MTPSLAVAVVVAGVVVAGVVIAARAFDAVVWRQSLTSYRLTLPSGLSVDDVAAWLGRIAASTHATRFGLLPVPPVMVTVVATRFGIRHELAVPASLASAVLAGLRAALPGVRIDELPGDQAAPVRPLVAAEARLRGGLRPLAVERAEATSAHLLASLLPLAPGESIRLTWIVTGAGTPAPVRSDLPVSGRTLDLLGSNYAVDSDELRAARLKQRAPLLHVVLRVVLRVGVVADGRPAAYRLFGRVWGALRGMNAPGAMVVRRLVPSFLVVERMQRQDLAGAALADAARQQ